MIASYGSSMILLWKSVCLAWTACESGVARYLLLASMERVRLFRLTIPRTSNSKGELSSKVLGCQSGSTVESSDGETLSFSEFSYIYLVMNSTPF